MYDGKNKQCIKPLLLKYQTIGEKYPHKKTSFVYFTIPLADQLLQEIQNSQQ